MKFCFMDSETTGLHATCTPWQFAFKISDFDGYIKDYNTFFAPSEDLSVCTSWVKENTILFKLMDSGRMVDSLTGFKRVIDFLEEETNGGEDRLFPVGQNLKFDMDVLSRFIHKYKHHYPKYKDIRLGKYFDYHHIDLSTITSIVYLSGEVDFPNGFSLFNTAKAVGIEVDEKTLHDAQYDVEILYQIFMKYNDMISIKLA